jgi:type II secretory pathway component PulF
MKKHILFILLFATILSSCSIEKRIYQPGYFISGRSSSPKEEKIHKKLQSEIFSESATTIAKEESSKVIEHEDTTRIKLNESHPIIEASNETKILPHEIPISAALASDSIPDESKLLYEKYEKNHKAKKKIKKIGFYPFIVTAFGFLMTGIFFVPWAYGALNNDNVFLTFLFTFLIGLAVLIPFIIVYIILTIITKKQRRKLRRMGLIK